MSATTPTTTYAMKGRLEFSSSGWVILQVPNDLGNGAFKALTEHGVEQPVSGTTGKYNAHVSVLRPEEVTAVGGPDAIKARGQTFGFNVGPIQEIEAPAGWADVSKVWVFQIKSPELMKFRRSLGLGPPKYPFHMTFAIRKKNALKVASIIHFEKDAAQNTEIKDSQIDGKGLFATSDFKDGDVIHPKFITKTQPKDGCDQWDQSEQCRYLNHSTPPNCVIVRDGDYTKLVADRDITKGEELTGDYTSCQSVLGSSFDFTYRGRAYNGDKEVETQTTTTNQTPEGVARANQSHVSSSGTHRTDHPASRAIISTLRGEGESANSADDSSRSGGDHHSGNAAGAVDGIHNKTHADIAAANVDHHASWSIPTGTDVRSNPGRTEDGRGDGVGSMDQTKHERRKHAAISLISLIGLGTERPAADEYFPEQLDFGGDSRGQHKCANILGHDGRGNVRYYGFGDSRLRTTSRDTADAWNSYGDLLYSWAFNDGRGSDRSTGGILKEAVNRNQTKVDYGERLKNLRKRRGECPMCGKPFPPGEPYPDVENCEVCETYGPNFAGRTGLVPTEKNADLLADIFQARKDTKEPKSEAHAAAGNYQKGKFRMHGMPFTLENPKGSTRSGTDKNGKAWSSTMTADYGYINGTIGKDGDHVDVFVGPDPEAEMVFVVDQMDPDTKKFDEHKVIFGYKTQADAKQGYLSNYSKGWGGLKNITALTMPQFRWWLEHGDQKKPLNGVTIKTSSWSSLLAEVTCGTY